VKFELWQAAPVVAPLFLAGYRWFVRFCEYLAGFLPGPARRLLLLRIGDGRGDLGEPGSARPQQRIPHDSGL
jgi:hypothetical protein